MGNKNKGFFICNKEDHKSIQCKAVTDTNKWNPQWEKTLF